MLLFYPFSGFFTKFTPPLQRIAAASVHSAPPTHLQKNCKKVAKNQPYASARRLCGSLWREPLWALCGHFCGSFWRSLCSAPFGELFGEPLRAPWGGAARSLCSAPSGELLGHLCGSLWREPLWALCGHLCGSCWRSLCSKPFGEFLGSLCGHLCGRNKKPVLEGRVPHTNINNTNNAMAEFSAFCFRYKGRTKRIMRQSPQLSIFVRVNSPDLGSKPPRYR